jgi:inner membrane transporter RhtA
MSITAVEHVSGPTAGTLERVAGRVPPTAFFFVSALFHYLGPAFAVLLFGHVDVLGVAWLRIASAGLVFAAWRRPWRFLSRFAGRDLLLMLAFGAVLAVMNSVFYLAIARLPLGTVGAIEFLGPITLAALGARRSRNWVALALTAAGVLMLAQVRLAGEPLGFVFAFANCALFVLYVVIGHRLSRSRAVSGIDQLALAMLVAAVVVTPLGILPAAPALIQPTLLAAGIAVGVCSSVIPYVTDQLAMARLSRATYALLLSLLPVFAVAIGAVVLRQVPRPLEMAGIGLVICGLLLHREAE